MPETNGNNNTNNPREPLFEERWQIPERFKAGFDTARQQALLNQNDARQKEWKEAASPAFGRADMAVRFRVKALETIKVMEPLFKAEMAGRALEAVESTPPINETPNPDTNNIPSSFAEEDPIRPPVFVFDDGMRNRLAESYAMLGRYDMAAETAVDEQAREFYEKYWNAVTRDDAEWCGHGSAHQYIKERMFSFIRDREVVLLACNICGEWNATDISSELRQRTTREDSVRQSTTGMGIGGSRDWMERNVGRKQ